NLASLNQLYPGQIIKIGVAPAALDNAPDIPAATVTPLPADSTDGVPLVGSNIHTVVSGETLFRIATQYHLSVYNITAANNISDPTLIYTGQQLIIPGSHTEPSALDLPAPMTGLSVKPLIFTEGETGSFRVTTETASIVTIEFLGKQLPI